jgi:hypothetical protein
MAGEFVDDAPKGGGQFVDSAPAKGGGQFVDDSAVKPNLVPTAYNKEMDAAGAQAGISGNEIRALHSIEDPTEDPKAKSKAGALGEMQLEGQAWHDYSKPGEQITVPKDNFDVSARYLSFLNKHYSGDMAKVFAAYNAGQGTVDAGKANNQAYVKQAEANLQYLATSLEPDRPTAQLAKGTPPKKPDKGPAEKSAEQVGVVDKMLKTADGASEAVLTHADEGYLGKGSKPILTPQQIDWLSKLPASKALASTGDILNHVVSLPLEFMNAAMRDMATGTAKNTGKAGVALGMALVNPTAMGTYLDRLSQTYGPNSADEVKFWSRQPGLAQMVAKAKPTTPEGQALQTIAAMHADTQRFLLTHTGIRDMQTFAEYFFSPGVHLPGLMAHGTGKLLTAGAKGVGKGIDVVPKYRDAVDNFNQTVKDHAGAIYTTMPMGDRFHASYVKAGEQGAAIHHSMAMRQAKAPEIVSKVFMQPNKLGNTTKEQRMQIMRYHDKFNNATDTVHLRQPQGGDPIYDPLTKTTVMNRGGLKGQTYDEHLQHVFATSPQRTRLKLGNDVATTALGPQAKEYRANLKSGRYAEALALHPGVSDVDAARFEAGLRANPLGHGTTPESRAWLANQTNLRLTSEHLTASGVHAADVGDQVVFANPVKGLERDLSDVAGETVDARTFYIAAAVHAIDSGLRKVAPESSSMLLDGYWNRSGMFKEEPTRQQIIDMQKQATQQKGAGGGAKPNATARQFDSIEHAEAPMDGTPFGGGGLKANEEFDPAEALQKSMQRSIQFQNYVRDLGKEAHELDYQDAVDNSGVGFTVNSELTFAMGKDGRKSMDELIDKEADARMKSGLSQQQHDAYSDPNSKERMDAMKEAIKTALYKQIDEAYMSTHPDAAGFRLENLTGVDDMRGLSAPQWAVQAAIDSHPAFQGGKEKSVSTVLGHEDTPMNKWENAIDSAFHFMRAVFLSNPIYHQVQNLSFIAAATGHLNPIELTQILFAPMTISKSLLEEAEEAGAFAPAHGHGFTKNRTRYGYASDSKPTDPNFYRRNTAGLPQRIRDTFAAYSRAKDGSANPLEALQHIFGRAVYQSDKWNSDITFKVFEDTTAAMIYGKFRRMGETKEAAVRKTRERMGDTLNLTESERSVKMQQMLWFYTWFKGQYRLWAKNVANPQVLRLSSGIQGTLQSRNENDPSLDPQDAQTMADRGQTVIYVNNKPYQMTVAPAPLRKLQAITSLVSTPATEGAGALDFMAFTTSDLAHTLNPAMKTAFEQMPDMFGNKSVMDNGPSGLMKKGLEGTADMLKPSIAPPFMDTLKNKDPVRLIEVLGVPVVPMDGKADAKGNSIVLSKLLKEKERLLYVQDSQEGRAAVREQFDPMIDQLTKQINSDRGH